MSNDVDYSTMYEAACYRFGIDNVTDKTYDEYPRAGTWKPFEEGTYKFEVNIREADFTEEELREILTSHGYQVWVKGDDRFSDGEHDYRFVAVVSQDSEPVEHEVTA